jgi:hypothetical protein
VPPDRLAAQACMLGERHHCADLQFQRLAALGPSVVRAGSGHQEPFHLVRGLALRVRGLLAQGCFQTVSAKRRLVRYTLEPPTPMSSSPAPASAASRIELAPAMLGADQQRLRSDWLKPTR